MSNDSQRMGAIIIKSMTVLQAAFLIGIIVILIGGVITIYGDCKNELFCLLTGPAIMLISLVFTIYVAFL